MLVLLTLFIKPFPAPSSIAYHPAHSCLPPPPKFADIVSSSKTKQTFPFHHEVHRRYYLGLCHRHHGCAIRFGKAIEIRFDQVLTTYRRARRDFYPPGLRRRHPRCCHDGQAGQRRPLQRRQRQPGQYRRWALSETSGQDCV